MTDIRDEPVDLPVVERRMLHRGMIFDLIAERVDLGAGGVVRREFVHHPGAVGILALDEQDRVLLVNQYRHPVRRRLWEVPAGLLDVPEEEPVHAASRELREEADLTARDWHVLVDWFNSPGGSDEAVRVFLARDLSEAPDRFGRQAEELDMPVRWVPLDEAVAAVLAGDVHNPTTVVALLAAVAARADGWSALRPPHAPWPQRRPFRLGEA